MPEGSVGGAGRSGRSGGAWKFLVIWIACAAFAYVFDQLTKAWVVATMEIGEVTPVIGELLQWHFIRNSGAAFSIGEDYTWIFTIVMVVVIIGIIIQARRLRSVWWSIGLGLLLGGAAGNLTDRLFREPSFGMGHVVDFIAFPNFAIFNIADSAIVGSVIVICILTFMGIGFDGHRHTDGKHKDGKHKDSGHAAHVRPGEGHTREAEDTDES